MKLLACISKQYVHVLLQVHTHVAVIELGDD